MRTFVDPLNQRSNGSRAASLRRTCVQHIQSAPEDINHRCVCSCLMWHLANGLSNTIDDTRTKRMVMRSVIERSKTVPFELTVEAVRRSVRWPIPLFCLCS